jgi:hypothetical protein
MAKIALSWLFVPQNALAYSDNRRTVNQPLLTNIRPGYECLALSIVLDHYAKD